METNVKNLHKQIANLLVANAKLSNPWRCAVNDPPPLFHRVLIQDGGMPFIGHLFNKNHPRYLALETGIRLSDPTEWMYIPKTREELEEDDE